MQLGSRWQAGNTPHPGVPELLHAAIAANEEERAAQLAGASWTLTWLEGRARVELLSRAADVLVDLSVAADGRVVARPIAQRGAAAAAQQNALRGPDPAAAQGNSDDHDENDDDEDDDDWLS